VSVLDNVIAAFHTRHDIPVAICCSRRCLRARLRCREEALGLLAFVGLEQRADLPAASLAYGEQRMLELARALAASPRLSWSMSLLRAQRREMERLIDRIRLRSSAG
jgi:branched-chain amino acid transport system ATP-binding protein